MNGQEQKTPADGISPDGYIVDQDCFSSVRYRTMRADWNGCGWIAAYNLRHYLGHEVGWDEVRAEMDAMHTLRVPGPTLMRVMRGYLSRYVPEYRETSFVTGRETRRTLSAISVRTTDSFVFSTSTTTLTTASCPCRSSAASIFCAAT